MNGFTYWSDFQMLLESQSIANLAAGYSRVLVRHPAKNPSADAVFLQSQHAILTESTVDIQY